jgi:hypothetical protein
MYWITKLKSGQGVTKGCRVIDKGKGKDIPVTGHEGP